MQFFRESVFPTNEIWLAVDREKGLPVGVIAFTSETVNHLYLLPEVQHRGIGSALLDIAKSHGKPLRLWTFQCNEVAKKFYAKHGFHVIKETDGAENEEGQPDLLFEWLP